MSEYPIIFIGFPDQPYFFSGSGGSRSQLRRDLHQLSGSTSFKPPGPPVDVHGASLGPLGAVNLWTQPLPLWLKLVALKETSTDVGRQRVGIAGCRIFLSLITTFCGVVVCSCTAGNESATTFCAARYLSISLSCS